MCLSVMKPNIFIEHTLTVEVAPKMALQPLQPVSWLPAEAIKNGTIPKPFVLISVLHTNM